MLTVIRQALRRVGITLDTFGRRPTTYRLFLPGRTLSVLLWEREDRYHPAHLKVNLLGGAGYARWYRRRRPYLYLAGITVWLRLDGRRSGVGVTRNANHAFKAVRYERPVRPQDDADIDYAEWKYNAGYQHAAGYHD